jgi:hypothetical protein
LKKRKKLEMRTREIMKSDVDTRASLVNRTFFEAAEKAERTRRLKVAIRILLKGNPRRNKAVRRASHTERPIGMESK